MGPKETAIYQAVLITSIVLIVIIGYFVLSLVRHQRRNLELHRQNILAEISTMEKERTRIAADLHDELGPMLSAIKFKISSVDAADEEDQYQLVKATTHIDDMIKRVREIAADLMPSSLLRKGLAVAVQEFVDNLDGADTRITYNHTTLPELSQEKSINIYRMVQEVVQNTLKHAQATELHIDMAVNGSHLWVTTIDNGVGFDYESRLKEYNGLGLRNLKSRVQIMAGDLNIQSKEGKGTRYLFKIPIV